MKTLIYLVVGLTVSMQPLPVAAQAALPLHVQSDLLTLRLENALSAGQGEEALGLVDQLRALGAGHPAGFVEILDARAALAADQFDRAQDGLTAFLSVAEPGTEAYASALELLAGLDARREDRLRFRLAQAQRAERLGNFDTAQAGYEFILTQAQSRGALYTETLGLLAGLDARRQALRAEEARARAQADAAQARARDAAAAEAARAQELQQLERAETLLAASERSFGDDVQMLRWVLNRRYSPRPQIAPHAGAALSVAERDLLVRYRRDMGLRDGLSDVGQRYLDARILAHARATDWAPWRESYEIRQGYAVFQDWIVYRERVEAAPGGARCSALTLAQAMTPADHYAMPLFQISVNAEGQNGALSAGAIEYVGGSVVTLTIDGREFALDVLADGSVQFFPSDERRIVAIFRGIRAGTVMTMTGQIPSLGVPSTTQFSLRGYTRAFRAMIEMCNRPDTAPWLN